MIILDQFRDSNGNSYSTRDSKASGKSLWQLQTISFAFNNHSSLETKVALLLSRYSYISLRKLEPAYRVFRCKL